MPEEPNQSENQEELSEQAAQSPDASAEPTADSEQPLDAEQSAENAESADDSQSETESIVNDTTDGPGAESADGPVPPADVEAAMEAMLDGGEPAAADEEPPSATGDLPTGAETFEPPDLSGSTSESDASQINLLDDVELDVKIELGRAEMLIEDVLALGAGSVVELDKAAGDPVDIYVNDRLVARGEVLVLNDDFCVRINDILSPVPELEEAR